MMQNANLICYWRTTETLGVRILSTMWTKIAVSENRPFGGSGLYNSRVEKQSVFRFGNVGHTGQDDCILPLERQRQREGKTD